MSAYVAFDQTIATGEGVTIWVAIANTEEEARLRFKEGVTKLGYNFTAPYFDPSVLPYGAIDSYVEAMIPDAVKPLLEGEPCHISFFQEFHFNAS